MPAKLYLLAGSTTVYTADATKGQGYVAGHEPAAVQIPAPNQSAVDATHTVEIDGVTHRAEPGIYALPSAATAPQFKIGTNYYTTIENALAAATISEATGFFRGTDYSDQQPTIPEEG